MFAKTAELENQLWDFNIIGRYYHLKDITPIKAAGGLILSGIDASSLYEYRDAEMLYAIARASSRIRKYLSKMDLSSKKSSERFLYTLCINTESGYGFAYGIRVGSVLIGMVLINTPAKNKISFNFPHWTLDCFIIESLENKGIMYDAVVRILIMLKSKLKVNEIYASVDPNNEHCIGLMRKLPFSEVQNDGEGRFFYIEGGRRTRLFVCDLEILRVEYQ